MFGRWSAKAADDVEGHALADAVRAALPAADDETRRIVTAIAGLLGGVAYADRSYAGAEEAVLRAELGRIHGMTPASESSPIVDVTVAVMVLA